MGSSKVFINTYFSTRPFQHVIWKVSDFFQLPRETGYFLDSPDFYFHGDRYCMRLFPQAVSVLYEEIATQFHVRRLSFNFPDREACCDLTISWRKPDGEESFNYQRERLEENRIYLRSSIENNRDLGLPDGSLTMECHMWRRIGNPALVEEEKGGFPGRNTSFTTRWRPTKMELTTESPCLIVLLTVCKFLERPREEVDSLASPEFSFSGDTFCFRFCPNADTGDTDLLLVRLTSTFTERTISYRAGLSYGSRVYFPYKSRSLVSTSAFCVSRSEIEQNKKCVEDGDLLLHVVLHLGEEAGTSDAAQERGGLTDIHKLQSDYGQLLQKGTGSDACIVVRGKEFQVHRNILRVRSTVFEAMFGLDTAEKKSGRVVVDDLDPDSFGQFLEYLYTGDVGAGLSNDNAFGLYAAAVKYDVSTLKSKCVDHMGGKLSVNFFCDVVTLALRHLEEDLLQKAIFFFKYSMEDIIVTPKWQQFMCDNPTGANELLIKAIVDGEE